MLSACATAATSATAATGVGLVSDMAQWEEPSGLVPSYSYHERREALLLVDL